MKIKKEDTLQATYSIVSEFGSFNKQNYSGDHQIHCSKFQEMPLSTVEYSTSSVEFKWPILNH